MRIIATVTKGIFKQLGFDIKRIQKEDDDNKQYSFSIEQEIIDQYLKKLDIDKGFIVDIGANDGTSFSNSYLLFRKGFYGLSIEPDGEAFSKMAEKYRNLEKVVLIKTKITPQNVRQYLKTCLTSKKFALLSLDIDSYDFHVLNEILSEYRPSLICSEINEKIPPPIKFSVNYDKNFHWDQSHFYGQSISQVYLLCRKYKYDIVKLEYNNIFLMPHEINKNKPMSPEEAYNEGYKNREDRKSKFPWNSDMEDLMQMKPKDGIKFINEKFIKYKGLYTIS